MQQTGEIMHPRIRPQIRPALKTALGITVWTGALAAFLLHASGTTLTDPLDFVLTDTWLIAAGCIGVPVLGLRILGNHLNPTTAVNTAIGLAAVAAFYTAYILAGQAHPAAIDAAFGLILFLAPGIQAYNAADALRRIAAARHEHSTVCAPLAEQRNRHLAALLDALDGLTAAQQEACLLAMQSLIGATAATDAEADGHLHLVHMPPAPTERAHEQANEDRGGTK